MRRTMQNLNIRLMTLLMAVLLLVCTSPTALAADASGQCGAGLEWTLEGGTLTITGSGAMTDFTEPEMAPWYAYREQILRLSLPEGLTSVGDLAFFGCKKLTAVVLPDSVERVGDFAFMDCTGMTLLDLGSGLRTVGEAAFSDCYALRSLELPDSLQSIGMKSFYRCESITTVTIPAGVTDIGVSAFGYCKKLVSADIRANVDEIPEFMFYGCERLVSVSLPEQVSDVMEYVFRGCEELGTVYYGGEEKTLEELRKSVGSDVVTNEAPDPIITGGGITQNSDGSITLENTTVTQGQNASVSASVEHTYPDEKLEGGSSTAKVQATVNGDEGWEEAGNLLNDALERVKNKVNADGSTAKTELDLYVKGTDTIDRKFLDSLAGQNVVAVFHTRDGSVWKVDCSEMDSENLSGAYDLSCVLSVAPQEICEELGTETAFVLRFNTSAQVNAEVLIALGENCARRNATLFQRDGGELVRFQTVVTDGTGYAHFYLASVSNEKDYYIAMDLAAENDDAIFPDELLAEYGEGAMRHQPIQYEITGRKSSWGMTINQVTWIMVGVLTVVVITVGVTMFLLNKRKLRLGYVPDLGDDKYEE